MESLDRKYLNLLSTRLEKFTQERIGNTIARCRCPLCGDSKKNPNKRRGYFYTGDNQVFFSCHNCQANHQFQTILEKINVELYKEYQFEKIQTGGREKRKIVLKSERLEKIEIGNLNGLTNVLNLELNHPARKYLIDRKIPLDKWELLFYTDNYKKWAFEFLGQEKYKDVKGEDERIVIPFFLSKGNPIAYQGRYIGKDKRKQEKERYLTEKVGTSNFLVFGLERVDLNKTAYLLEGPIDSLFIPNALAASGSGLKRLLNSPSDIVFVFDNEPRSPEILALMEDVIAKGRKIVIWPHSVKGVKDVNDMIKKGIDVYSLICDNTYSKLEARAKFAQWKRK